VDVVGGAADDDIDQSMVDGEDAPTSGEMQKWQLLRLKEMMRRMKLIIMEKENQKKGGGVGVAEGGNSDSNSDSRDNDDDGNDIEQGEDGNNDNSYFNQDFNAREQSQMTQKESFFKDLFNSNQR